MKARANSGKGYKDSPRMWNAIQKYGWDNVTTEEFPCNSPEELDNLERDLIKKYNTTNPDFGYNIQTGGRIGSLSPSISIPVFQYNLNGNFLAEFSSLGAAARAVHGDSTFIKKATESLSRTAYGYIWRLQKEEITQKDIELAQEVRQLKHIMHNRDLADKKKKPVLVFDINQNSLIDWCQSQNEAVEEYSLPKTSLTKHFKRRGYYIKDNLRFEPDINGQQKKTILVKYHVEGLNEISQADPGSWFDLYSAENVHLNSGESKLISLGISMKLPLGYGAILAPRSSLFGKTGLIMANSIGIIDSTYCGTNDVWRFNAYATKECDIKFNQKIAQFRIMPVQDLIEFTKVTELNSPDRGGIGSTGGY